MSHKEEKKEYDSQYSMTQGNIFLKKIFNLRSSCFSLRYLDGSSFLLLVEYSFHWLRIRRKVSLHQMSFDNTCLSLFQNEKNQYLYTSKLDYLNRFNGFIKEQFNRIFNIL
jgi:hypothetical protein